MCGIAGFFHPEGLKGDAEPIVRQMLKLIEHRGPDEMGYYLDAFTAFGTARLSIIDLSTGQQPIGDRSGRYWICYNGEVYNYKELRSELESLGCQFETETDTEVVLAAWQTWGTDALARLNGAFGFAIYDRKNRELILVRDRFGKRPLYYTLLDRQLLFASELKAFLAHDEVNFQFDEIQLSSIFLNWTPLPDQTGYQNLAQLPMGCYLRMNSSGHVIKPYAELQLDVEPFQGSEAEAAERTRELLSDSVRIRLRSDVEVGTYLSGGIDSTITTLLAIENGNNKVNTFSVSFEDKSFDESKKQKELSQFLGTRHHSVRVGNKDIAELFPEAIWHGEVPVFRTAFVPLFALSKLVQQQGIKVVLTGEGADEAFVGYNIFKETLLRSRWQDYASEQQRLDVISRLYPYMSVFDDEHIRTLASLYQRFSENVDSNLFPYGIRHNMSQFSLRLLNGKHDATQPINKWIDDRRSKFGNLDVVKRTQWLEFNTLLAGYLLSTQGDRMSLAHGVENRCPFLDYRVVEWASSLPLEFNLADGMNEKFMLKKAFGSKLPEMVVQQPKQPYRAPDLIHYMGHQKSDILDAVLSENELAKVDVLNASFCNKFMKKVFDTPADKISPRESHTFMFLISVALLHSMFVRRQYSVKPVPDSRFVKVIDQRIPA